MTPLRRLLAFLSASVVLAGTAVATSPLGSVAQAGPINVNPCNGAPLSQPFARWGDPAWYELTPAGDFEKPGWRLSGEARRVAGSEPYAATGKLGSWSLSLPAGSSAQSPSTCVDAAYPSLRFFIEGSGSVAVTIVDGSLQIPAGVATASGQWLPTPVMLTSSAVLAAASNGTATVSLRLTGHSGDPRVDDVFLDPWNRG